MPALCWQLKKFPGTAQPDDGPVSGWSCPRDADGGAGRGHDDPAPAAGRIGACPAGSGQASPRGRADGRLPIPRCRAAWILRHRTRPGGIHQSRRRAGPARRLDVRARSGPIRALAGGPCCSALCGRWALTWNFALRVCRA